MEEAEDVKLVCPIDPAILNWSCPKPQLEPAYDN